MTLLKTVYSTSLTICFEIDNFMPIRKNKKTHTMYQLGRILNHTKSISGHLENKINVLNNHFKYIAIL